MNEQEIQSLINQLKAAGLNDEQIMEVFYESFKSGEMDRADLETLAEAMGYELTDGFKNDATPDPISAPESGANAEGDGAKVDEASAENLKEIKPGESPEEFKEKVEEAKGDDNGAENKPEDNGGGEGEGNKSEEEPGNSEEQPSNEPAKKDDEDEGWEEAQKRLKW